MISRSTKIFFPEQKKISKKIFKNIDLKKFSRKKFLKFDDQKIFFRNFSCPEKKFSSDHSRLGKIFRKVKKFSGKPHYDRRFVEKIFIGTAQDPDPGYRKLTNFTEITKSDEFVNFVKFREISVPGGVRTLPMHVFSNEARPKIEV